MATTFTVGGKEYTVPELNFYAVERAWPLIVQSMESMNPMVAASAGLDALVAGIVEDEHFRPGTVGLEYEGPVNGDYSPEEREVFFQQLSRRFKRQLKAKEMGGISLAINELVAEAGLLPEAGEPLNPEEIPASLSPGTAADTSQSSLPLGAAEETGTA